MSNYPVWWGKATVTYLGYCFRKDKPIARHTLQTSYRPLRWLQKSYNLTWFMLELFFRYKIVKSLSLFPQAWFLRILNSKLKSFWKTSLLLVGPVSCKMALTNSQILGNYSSTKHLVRTSFSPLLLLLPLFSFRTESSLGRLWAAGRPDKVVLSMGHHAQSVWQSF